MAVVGFAVSSGKGTVSCDKFNGILLPLALQEKKTIAELLPTSLEKKIKEAVVSFAGRIDFKVEAQANFSFDLSTECRLVVFCLPQDVTTFKLLGLARKTLKPLLVAKSANLMLEMSHLPEAALVIADGFASALEAAQYNFKKYGAKPAKKKAEKISLHFHTDAKKEKDVLATAHAAQLTTRGTNLVRELAMRAGNDLTCKSYHAEIKKIAEHHKLTFSYIPQSRLKTMKAGAFLAVCQGSPHQDAGIAKVVYNPPKAKKHLVLVGKGIVYDTGGTNVKPARSMYGMHGDMAGSAVALALVQLAKEEKWPCQVTAFLAIADNMIGNQAYRPNDIVTALSGKTIEVIHTDAEGRMVLADTLHLATQEKADFIMDFATLTGACVMAIGTTYAGGFTNRKALVPLLIKAGETSGERLWPFPLDDEFGECLESKVADIKQCRLSGGVDHIEAAYFLKEFVGDKTPWVHIDLAASENEGGLGHIPGNETGFGVRIGRAIAKAVLESKT